MMNKKEQKEFVNSCTIVFKTFGHRVIVQQKQTSVWHFVSHGRENKVYAVFCAPKLKSSQALIKVGLKQSNREKMRFVVITAQEPTDDDVKKSEELGYALIDLKVLRTYGEKMLEVQSTSEGDTPAAVAVESIEQDVGKVTFE